MSSENINIQSNLPLNEISIKELILKFRMWWRYFVSRWVLLLACIILGCGAGYAYAYFKKPVYTATTTFVLEDEKSGGGGLGSLAGLASVAGLDLGGGASGIFQGDNILQLYKSRTMLEQTLLTQVDFDGKRQLLVDKYIEFNHMRDKWLDKPKLLDLRFSSNSVKDKRDRLADSVLGVIVNNIKKDYLLVTKPDKKLSIIQVDVSSKSESFSKAFNDQLVKNVNEFYIATKTKKTLQNVRVLKLKTDSVRAIMNGAIYTAVAVTDATPNLNPTRQVQRVAPAQRAQFSAETNKAILAEMVKNLEMTKMSLLNETPLIQVVDQPIYPLSKVQTGKLKAMAVGGFIFFLFAIAYLFANVTFKQWFKENN